jgi:hypothetical protein
MKDSIKSRDFFISLNASFANSTLKIYFPEKNRRELNNQIKKEYNLDFELNPLEFYRESYLVKKINLGENKFLELENNILKYPISFELPANYFSKNIKNEWDKESIENIFGIWALNYYRIKNNPQNI